MSAQSTNARWAILLPIVAVLALVIAWLGATSRNEPNRLVVYCAHDAVYADQILKDFERQSGIRVDVRYDTEATKSLGLINMIIQEQRYPRCDVFWNNEMLGTVDLQAQGLLEPYKGTAWERLPDKYRDPDGYWVGFGARMRVIIVNERQISADEGTIQNVVSLEPSRAAIAKPLFGTTLTHYTVLWDAWGPERVKAWHHELRLRGLREVNGNGPVKDVVVFGTCDVGLTDTDDVFVAIDDGQPVEMVPVRVKTSAGVDRPVSALGEDEERSLPLVFSEPGQQTKTICVPNTAAIIRGTQRHDAARKLIDFLASAETELALARSKSRQVPLGPVNDADLPEQVRPLKAWAEDGYDLRPLLPARRECLQWLKSEYLK